MGWDTVEPLEYGLKCNSVSKKCDVEEGFLLTVSIIIIKILVYSGGRFLFIVPKYIIYIRYFVGFFNYFINYPSNY